MISLCMENLRFYQYAVLRRIFEILHEQDNPPGGIQQS